MMTIGGWHLTEHARQRMQQRAVRPWMVAAALQWGIAMAHHGHLCYIVTDKGLETAPFEGAQEQLRGLCVVVNPAEGCIVTVKWLFHLRRRSPRPWCLRWKNRRGVSVKKNGHHRCSPSFLKEVGSVL